MSLTDDKAGRDTRLKPKRKQEVGKRGPMKAVVPVNNMTRASGLEKKGEEFWGCSFHQHINKQWIKCYILPPQCYRYCSYHIIEALTEEIMKKGMVAARMLCIYTAHFYVSKKDIVVAVIPVQILSKGAQGQCSMIGRYLLYHTKLLSTAVVGVQDCKTDIVDIQIWLPICVCACMHVRERVHLCAHVCSPMRLHLCNIVNLNFKPKMLKI